MMQQNSTHVTETTRKNIKTGHRQTSDIILNTNVAL
jgi:hypothetical protein